MEVKIYLFDRLLATLTFKSGGQGWYLASQSMHVGETPEIRKAIAIAVSSVTTDVFQPTGRRVLLNDVSYVAKNALDASL